MVFSSFRLFHQRRGAFAHGSRLAIGGACREHHSTGWIFCSLGGWELKGGWLVHLIVVLVRKGRDWNWRRSRLFLDFLRHLVWSLIDNYDDFTYLHTIWIVFIVTAYLSPMVERNGPDFHYCAYVQSRWMERWRCWMMPQMTFSRTWKVDELKLPDVQMMREWLWKLDEIGRWNMWTQNYPKLTLITH